MDGLALSVLVNAVTRAAAGEAGRSAWQGLMELGRRVLGHTADTDRALEKARDGGDSAMDLAGELHQAAARDPEILAAIRQWIAAAAAAPDGATVNVNHGGSVGVQARNVTNSTVITNSSGPIHTGSGSQHNHGGNY